MSLPSIISATSRRLLSFLDLSNDAMKLSILVSEAVTKICINSFSSPVRVAIEDPAPLPVSVVWVGGRVECWFFGSSDATLTGLDSSGTSTFAWDGKPTLTVALAGDKIGDFLRLTGL